MIGNINEVLHNYESIGLLLFAALVCTILALLLVWLLARSVRLWYWKVNSQVETLKSIDEKLQAIGEDIKANSTGVAEESEATIEGELEVAGIEKLSESKAEKVYTEEELEELIKD